MAAKRLSLVVAVLFASIAVAHAQQPTVTGLTQTSGPQAGGTTTFIFGSGFTGATAVTFGATPATSFTVDQPNLITAVSPAGTGTVDVTVTTPGGTSAIVPADQFNYLAVPTITSISPSSGPVAGGSTVTINGTGFTSFSTSVTFGATASSSLTFISSTQITALVPAGAVGTVDVKVTTPGGTSAITPADQFTYVDAPTITSISPTSGPAAGGTTVTITGTGFTGATAVAFGGTAAMSFTVNSATQITATSPAGTGTVDVQVTTLGGTSPISAADRFTYPPTVTSVGPISGPPTGGTTITISGAGFTGATTVKFGANNATSFTVNSATSITAVSPAGAGTVDVTVSNLAGTSPIVAADQFIYFVVPTLTSISPNSGPTGGGGTVTINGSGFGTSGTGVTFGGTGSPVVNIISSTVITAVVPPGAAGTVDVRVTTDGGTSAISAADQFTYVNGPAVTSISPQTGPSAGGTTVTIAGANFTGTTAVKFGANNATSFTVNSATSITAVSPAGTGTVDVTVTANAQTTATSPADRFTYQASTTTTAVVSSLNPSDAGQAVTFTATVTATGGPPTGTVTFNDNGAPIGTVPLAGGVAALTISTLTTGAHAVTATYNGSAAFLASTSPILTQTVNIPADSAKLRALQVNVSKVVAQNSGQAISGAVDGAISEGFSDSNQFMTPSGTGMRFNFSADEQPAADEKTANVYSGGNGSGAPQSGRATGGSRVDNAFAALDPPATKAPPAKFREHKEWMFWADVRGSGVDRWSGVPTNPGTPTTQANMFGSQLNLTGGLSYKPTESFLIGVLGGYETFSYTEQDINGRLKGDGWTVGGYAGWKIMPTLRWDAAVAYSGIGYNGVAGTAAGNFSGNRWLAWTGLTGTYKFDGGLVVEPSAKVYALWEHQNAYTDSLGTLQTARDFATGRASAGVKFAYIMGWWDSVQVMPYVGAYGDYYFTQDNTPAIALAGGVPLASVPLIDGWSARVTGGIGARFDGGVMLSVGGELGGIGSNTRIWTVTGRARVPFSAQ